MPDDLSPSSRTPPVLLTGPTASGKSAVAIELARALRGEIISVDSMQVYRGLDIGTSKPSIDQRRGIAHHLIDVCDLTEEFHAARFLVEARSTLDEIEARRVTPVFCGGTGLYFKAWIEGLDHPGASDARMREELAEKTLEQLLAELEARDPGTFERIDRRNRRRVERAVEIVRVTGGPIASRAGGRGARGSTSREARRIFCLRRDRDELRGRIERRVEGMFDQGLVDETRRLLTEGLERNQVAMQAIGYRQVVEYLRGEHSLEETIELVKVKTWQFARRQMTWFRHQFDVEWIDVRPDEGADETARRVAGMIEA